MAVIYDFKKGPAKAGEGEKDKLYPHVISEGTITTHKLLLWMSKTTSFSYPELSGFMMALSDQVLDYLKDGYRVELGEIGYLSLSLKSSKEVTDIQDIHAASVRIDNVKLRTSAQYRKKLNGEVMRIKGTGFHHSSITPLETKRSCLLNYLEQHPYITRTEYGQLTRQLKNKALDDLHLFKKEGIICSRGKGSHLVYLKCNTPE